MHATILNCSLFIVHWPHFIVHSFHNIVQPDVQHVVHNEKCAIVHNFEQLVPTLGKMRLLRVSIVKKIVRESPVQNRPFTN